ncbi:MAG: T9SS type A sorting domain-containing protein, partial [Candidatus Zixiibacteriota bacterium]
LLAEWVDGKSRIVINSIEELMGLEMELTAADSEEVNVANMVDNMRLYHSQNGDKITLAILDIEGRQILAPGMHVVLEIGGPVEIKHVLGSNPQAEAVNLEIIHTDRNADLIPEAFSLGQNRPNPFNPITEINFSLPVSCQVSLDVYNIAGQKVASVADGQFEAGHHSVIWDASSQASGIYFYRLKAGEFVETRKMMLLK